jgi:penicillin-binding protein 1C
MGVAIALAASAAGVLLLAAWRSHLVAPEPTLLLQDRHGRFLGEIGDSSDADQGYWPLESVPERVAAATLAIEDRRFWSHPGVDPFAAVRALRQNLGSGRRISGASTLAMQVARMQHPGHRHLARKAVEALSALLMTARHGREAILTHYLRIVPYGNRIRGIAYAARRYLDKPVEDLSWAEIAFLTAIPQAPARMNPFYATGRERAVRRGTQILASLKTMGVMSAEEHDLALRQIDALRVPPRGERPRLALHAVLKLEEALRADAIRKKRAHRPIIRTTLDLDMQEAVAYRTFKAVESWADRGARNAAVVVLDRKTAEVLAWVGSIDYFDRSRAGAIDYARILRSPGSALKPFFYALALDRGVITPATILDDLGRGAGGITNADELFLGPLLPRVALANSRNVPTADLLARIGPAEGYAFLRDLGLHDGEEPARKYGLGLAIGGMPVTLETLVRAYTVLANDGRVSNLVWSLDEAPLAPKRLLAEESARLVTLFLSDPMARLPSFGRMGVMEYPFPVAVKTGTSSRFRDAWAVAYSSRYLVGAWAGDPDFQSMNRLTGYTAAAALVRWILLDLHRDQTDGLQDLVFPPPRGFEPVRLCALTGHLATDACDRVFLEWMRPGEAPVAACAAHIRAAVDTRTSRAAREDTPRRFIEVRTAVDLPPRYAAWLATSGLPRQVNSARAESMLPSGASSSPAASVRLAITSPENGLRVLRDPETPAEQATLPLKAIVDPPVAQVVWYVDGHPWETVTRPYATRWPLRPGPHIFQARLALGGPASQSVHVLVE